MSLLSLDACLAPQSPLARRTLSLVLRNKSSKKEVKIKPNCVTNKDKNEEGKITRDSIGKRSKFIF